MAVSIGTEERQQKKMSDYILRVMIYNLNFFLLRFEPVSFLKLKFPSCLSFNFFFLVGILFFFPFILCPYWDLNMKSSITPPQPFTTSANDIEQDVNITLSK